MTCLGGGQKTPQISKQNIVIGPFPLVLIATLDTPSMEIIILQTLYES